MSLDEAIQLIEAGNLEAGREILENLQYKYRLMETLTTMISFEVRTPLTAIRGYSGLLLQDKIGAINEKQKECLTVIDDYAKSVMTVFEQFSNAHRALLGHLFLNFEEVDIGKLLQAIKPDNLDLKISKEIPKIWVDPHHLAQAFKEFFSEATSVRDDTITSLQIRYDSEQINFRIVSEGDRGYLKKEGYLNPMLFYAQVVIEQHNGEYQLVRSEDGVEIIILLPINRKQASV